MISTALSALNLSKKTTLQIQSRPGFDTEGSGQLHDYGAILAAGAGRGGLSSLPIVKIFLNVATPGCEEADLGQLIILTVCPSALQLLPVLEA